MEASPDRPILIDKFLEDAIEVDVDAVADGERCVVAGIMEHIEEAGVHSGDSACVLPPHTLSPAMVEEIRGATRALALELGVRGLMNVQYAVKAGLLYVLEVNPGPAARCPSSARPPHPLGQGGHPGHAGPEPRQPGHHRGVPPRHISVKEAVFPFARFPGWTRCWGPRCAPPAR